MHAGSVHFAHPSTPDLRVHVVSFPQASQLIAYASIMPQPTPRHRPQRRQLLLPMGSPGAPDSNAALAHWHGVAAKARDRLAHWALAAMRSRAGLPPAWGLLALPQGVLMKLLGSIDHEGLAACACVCSALRAAVQDDALWLERLRTDFAGQVPPLKVRNVHAGTLQAAWLRLENLRAGAAGMLRCGECTGADAMRTGLCDAP